MTYDGSQMRLYVNGTAYGPTSAALGINTARPLRFGAGGTEGTGNYWLAHQRSFDTDQRVFLASLFLRGQDSVTIALAVSEFEWVFRLEQ